MWYHLYASCTTTQMEHAQDIHDKNYFDHISPSESLAIQRAQQAGYTGNNVMENIGKGYAAIDAVMAAWKRVKVIAGQ